MWFYLALGIGLGAVGGFLGALYVFSMITPDPLAQDEVVEAMMIERTIDRAAKAMMAPAWTALEAENRSYRERLGVS